jgi:hypothetical protein
MTIQELIDRLKAVEGLNQDIYILDSKAAMLRPVTDVTVLDNSNFVAIESEYLEICLGSLDGDRVLPVR